MFLLAKRQRLFFFHCASSVSFSLNTTYQGLVTLSLSDNSTAHFSEQCKLTKYVTFFFEIGSIECDLIVRTTGKVLPWHKSSHETGVPPQSGWRNMPTWAAAQSLWRKLHALSNLLQNGCDSEWTKKLAFRTQCLGFRSVAFAPNSVESDLTVRM